MRSKVRVDPSEQSTGIYLAKCKGFSSCYAEQFSRKLATQPKEHRVLLRTKNIKTPLISLHCVDTGHSFDLAEKNDF